MVTGFPLIISKSGKPKSRRYKIVKVESGKPKIGETQNLGSSESRKLKIWEAQNPGNPKSGKPETYLTKDTLFSHITDPR